MRKRHSCASAGALSSLCGRCSASAGVDASSRQTHKASRWFFYWAPYGPHHPMLEDGDAYLENFRKLFTPYPFYTASENDARCRGLALVPYPNPSLNNKADPNPSPNSSRN